MKLAAVSDNVNQSDYISPNDNKRLETSEAKTVKTNVQLKESMIENKDAIDFDEKKIETKDDIITAIEKANEQIRIYDKRLEFSIHEETNKIMIKVVSLKDNTVIREVPSEKVLNMVANIWDMAGMLVDERR